MSEEIMTHEQAAAAYQKLFARHKQQFSHLQFSGGRHPERSPLVLKIGEEWSVAQPFGEEVIAWPLPPLWQEWMEAGGGWRFTWSDDDEWILRYVDPKGENHG